MHGEQRLFEGAPEAAIIGAHYVAGEGWALRLQIRRQFQDWTDARTEEYERLTTDELVEVLDSSLGTLRAALGF